MQSQRLMNFISAVDKPEAKFEHIFCFNFSKKFIKEKKLLNIGCWTGAFEILAINAASKIVSVDIEEKALKILKENLPNIECHKAFSHKLPFKNNSFDVVTFWAVIEHIPVGYELATLKEINRVLKPGGYLFLTTMSKNFWSNLLDPAYWLVGHRHYTGIKLKTMFQDAGFETQKIQENGSFVVAFHAWAFYFFKHILRMSLPKIKLIEKMFEKDLFSEGFYQIAIRGRKINILNKN